MTFRLRNMNMVKSSMLFQVIVISFFLHIGQVDAETDNTSHIMTRTSDPIVIPASTFKTAAIPIKNINLYTIKDGNKRAIPFQVDERNKKGKYIFPFGQKANPEESDGVFSGNDELVFMIKDTGDRAISGMFPKCDSIMEIEIIDPVDESNRWIYLVKTSLPPTDLSTEDYVNYDITTTTIDAKNYIMRFDPDFTIGFARLSAKPVFGGTGDNWVDRVKIRLDVKTRFGFRIIKDEDAFSSSDLAHIDGPVRVIRRTANQVKLWWKIKSPSAIIDNIFYYDYYYYPMKINIPLDPSLLFSEGIVRVSQDWLSLNREKQIKYYNSKNTGGVTIDGKMSDTEKALNRGSFDWSATLCNNGKGPGTLSRLVRREQLGHFDYNLYYMDDLSITDGPEKESGHFGDTGYCFNDISAVKRGMYILEMHQFIVPAGYEEGSANNYMNIMDNKLQYNVTEFKNITSAN